MDIALITYPMETNPAGIGVNVRNIVASLLALDSENRYHLLHFSPSDDPLYRRANEVVYRRLPGLPVMVSDSLFLARNPRRFDIVHRFSPGGFILPTRARVVVTVNDLFLYKRYSFNRRTRNALAAGVIRGSLRRADAVTALSHFTRREVLRTFRLAPEKVHVVGCAPGIGPADPATPPNAVPRRYGVFGPYILFVSTIEPRKNLLGLVRAFEILKSRHGIVEKLVVAGKPGWDTAETLGYIRRSACRNDIHLLGFVPEADLPGLYRDARLFVYPSFMEGFGIPPLEAMACGCPVLTSNTGSLPEMIRRREMMFDPRDVEAMAVRCLAVLRDARVRSRNRACGRSILQRYSWRRSARRLMEIYRRLGAGRVPPGRG